MIEVRCISREERDSWNRYIEQSPQSIAWQIYEWSEVVARHYEYRFFPLAALEDTRVVGVLPLYLGAIGNGRGFISVPFAVAGGVVGESEEVHAALVGRAIAMSREEGGLPVVLKQYKLRMPGGLKTDENYINSELPLHRDMGILRQCVGADNLKNAECALDLGLEVEYPAEDIPAFYDLLLRYNHAQGIPCVSEKWIRTLIDFGMYSIALGRYKGSVLAGTMVKKFKKTVSFPFSCVLPRKREGELAAYGLYWNLISRFAAEGFEIFHSGRIPKNQETARYRLGWGGTLFPYYYQYYPNTSGPTEFTTRRGLKRRIASFVWKRLPIAAARSLGPRLVRRFP